jgi:hypothetical protein
MVEDGDLAEFLSGAKGPGALDMARELVGLRKQVELVQAQCAEAVATSVARSEAMEVALGQHSEARARLGSICEALANMCAGLREYLGDANAQGEE